MSGSSVDLNSLGRRESAAGQLSKSAPEVFVFGNADFVATTSSSIQSRTGVAPHAVDIGHVMKSAPLLNQAAVPTLDRLLARPSLLNVFFGIAIDGRIPSDILTRLDSLASRGASVYVTIGSGTPHDLASELSKHPGFTTVPLHGDSKSDSVVGEDGSSGQFVVEPVSGNPGGLSIDLIKADEVLRGTQDMIDVSGLPETSVASVQALAREGLISPSMQTSLELRSGLSLDMMQDHYIHLLELWTLQSMFADVDAISLYEVDSGGKLAAFGQAPDTASQTPGSEARDAIADDVARFIAKTN
ncbi:MAG: hypothetical protein AB8C46_07820 [Burkholderiaceae bacterium]